MNKQQKTFKWTWAHTEDGFAVCRHHGRVAIVYHNGFDYDWMIMTDLNDKSRRLGLTFYAIKEGREPNHNKAREEAEATLSKLT